MKKTRNEIMRTVKNSVLIVLGTFLIAFGTGMFIIPFQLVTGGVSGIGIVIRKALEGVPALSAVTTEVYASIVNWILFFLGLVFLGRAFAAKTLISAIVYPVALSLTSALVNSGFMGGFFDLTSVMYAGYGQAVLMVATVFGGAFVGSGVAITFLGGGSSGGTDILALLVCKFAKRVKSSVMIFVVDAAVILIGVFAINNLVISLLGICSAFICAIAVDRIFLGTSGALTAIIVSDKYEQINEAIIKRLARTTTATDAVGGYSGKRKKQIQVTFSMRQYAEFSSIMKDIDENAFITINKAHEINGEGWTYDSPRSTEDGAVTASLPNEKEPKRPSEPIDKKEDVNADKID